MACRSMLQDVVRNFGLCSIEQQSGKVEHEYHMDEDEYHEECTSWIASSKVFSSFDGCCSADAHVDIKKGFYLPVAPGLMQPSVVDDDVGTVPQEGDEYNELQVGDSRTATPTSEVCSHGQHEQNQNLGSNLNRLMIQCAEDTIRDERLAEQREVSAMHAEDLAAWCRREVAWHVKRGMSNEDIETNQKGRVILRATLTCADPAGTESLILDHNIVELRLSQTCDEAAQHFLEVVNCLKPLAVNRYLKPLSRWLRNQTEIASCDIARGPSCVSGDVADIVSAWSI